MAKARRVLKRARQVSRDELTGFQVPEATAHWFPVAHTQVLRWVTAALEGMGHAIARETLVIMKSGDQFVGTLDLTSQLAEGTTLAVSIRNSVDRSFVPGVCAGSRVACGDHIAFRADLMVKQKLWRKSHRETHSRIVEAIGKLGAFHEREAARIERMRRTPVGEDRADALILRAYEQGIIIRRDLAKVLKHWRNPEFDEFRPRTYWSLLNAFTGAFSGVRGMAMRMPHRYVLVTMRLNAMLEAHME